MDVLVCSLLTAGYAAFAAAVFWTRRTAQAVVPPTRTCPKCRYLLEGLGIDAGCPECGLSAALRDQMHTSLEARGRAIAAGVVPALAGWLYLQTVLQLISGAGIAGWLFAGAFNAVPFMGLAAFVAWRSAHLGAWTLLIVSTCGVLAVSAIVTLAYVDAFVWHLDPQSGIVIVMVPVFGLAALGYGLLAGTGLVRLVEWGGRKTQ